MSKGCCRYKAEIWNLHEESSGKACEQASFTKVHGKVDAMVPPGSHCSLQRWQGRPAVLAPTISELLGRARECAPSGMHDSLMASIWQAAASQLHITKRDLGKQKRHL